MSNISNKLNFGERSGRLVLITAVLGVLGAGYFKILKFTLNNLANKIYLSFFISYEHIIAACMLSSAFLILVYAIYYCYCEFAALNYTNRDEGNNEALQVMHKADLAYNYVFKFSSLAFILSGITIVMYINIVGFLSLQYLVMGVTIFLFLLFLFFLAFKNIRQELCKSLVSLKNYIISNRGKIASWFITTFIIIYFIFITMSFSQTTVFTTEFSNKSSAPIKFHFENSVPDKITLQFYFVDKDNNEHLTKQTEIETSQFRRSFIEVTEQSQQSKESSIITFLNDEMSKSQDAYIAEDSHYDYNYELNSIDYLKKGKNFVIILFNKNSMNNNKNYRIVNQIDINENGDVIINQDKFQEKF
ncbi:hypothetical protein SAMN04487969_10667 [Paenibacillus algorifonticola]|uniref:Uncharacterized protein n=1 Tax=Paenibacillus algorifonticola TaxID=684063 RepID=A0A1I2D2K8_9BACL|nr:hypothetical protein [Paenibacillus algorifonticola]SFE74758.1 hypothetical protein SAMN04487969_10667 [Paenibacillus algorifonticola]